MTQNEMRAKVMLRLMSIGSLADDVNYDDNGAVYKYTVNDGTGAWFNMSIRFNGRDQVTLGGTGVCTKHRRYGIATVQVFTPRSSGEYDNDTLCAAIETEFTKQTGDKPLVYGGSSSGGDVRTVSVGTDDSWYQQNVIIPISADETIG